MIKNLTPHTINIMPENIAIEPSGSVARVAVTHEELAPIDGIRIVSEQFGLIEGLPDPEEGVYLIVSGMVKAAAKGRNDLLSPGKPVRDADGRIVGCGCLAT